jgi:hypothetical protein
LASDCSLPCIGGRWSVRIDMVVETLKGVPRRTPTARDWRYASRTGLDGRRGPRGAQAGPTAPPSTVVCSRSAAAPAFVSGRLDCASAVTGGAVGLGLPAAGATCGRLVVLSLAILLLDSCGVLLVELAPLAHELEKQL